MSKHYYHKGTYNKLFDESEVIPEGFILGMYLSEESRNRLRKIGDANPMKRKEISKKVGDAQRGEKSWRYGLHESPEAKRKNSLAHMGDKNAMKRPEVSSKVAEKLKGVPAWNSGLAGKNDPRCKISQEAILKRVETFNNLSDEIKEQIVQKRNCTMKQNGTTRSSRPEEEFYLFLKQILDKDDIERNYSSDKYPFKVDFYIKSLDLYIECNFSDFHHKHPFDANNNDDVAEVESLKEKSKNHKNPSKNRYNSVIYTWTDLDKRKQMIAIQNELNYIALYDNNKNRWTNDLLLLNGYNVILKEELQIIDNIESQAKELSEKDKPSNDRTFTN